MFFGNKMIISQFLLAIFMLSKHFPNNSGRKKGWVEPHLNDPNFWGKQLVHRYLQNNICYFRSPILPWRGPRYFELFSRHGLFFTMPKISLHWVPLQPFLNINHDFGHICFLKYLWKFIGEKSGSYSGKKIICFCLVVFFYWETSV